MILSLVVQIYADAADMDGFFLLVVYRDAQRPNRLIWLTHLGTVSLALGVGSLGVRLLAG